MVLPTSAPIISSNANNREWWWWAIIELKVISRDSGHRDYLKLMKNDLAEALWIIFNCNKIHSDKSQAKKICITLDIKNALKLAETSLATFLKKQLEQIKHRKIV